jgi:hypothetical protein
MDSSLEFKERKYRIMQRHSSDIVRKLYHKKEEPLRRDNSQTISKKALSSSMERDNKHRLAKLTIISSDSSALSQSEKLGGSQGSIRRKTLETYGKYFLRSRSNQIKSRKIAQIGKETARLKTKKFSSRSGDRKRSKSVASKKKKNQSFDKKAKKKPPPAMSTIQPKMRTIDSHKQKTYEPKKMRTI